MGIFNFLVNEKNQWRKIFNDLSIDDDLIFLIQDFLIYDNISENKFIENYRANNKIEIGSGLEYWEKASAMSISGPKKINCTETFRKHFSNDTMNRGSEIPDWFYFIYPDVAFWFHQNEKIFEKYFEENENIYFTESGGLERIFFRELINRYKNENGKLECSN